MGRVKNTDTSGFGLKNKYDTDRLAIEKKIPDTSRLVEKTDYNAKITKIETKIPSISGLATTSALNGVENKITDVTNLVKKKRLWCKLFKTKITKISFTHGTIVNI